ncbi:MAG: hypothetical protein WD942_09945 [Dehalococcoidia bacterium]
MPRLSTHGREAAKWLLWACVIGLTPLWVSLLLVAIVDGFSKTSSLFDQGQLALYAAGMAGTALYLASIDREPAGMRLRTTINLSSLVIMLVAILVFTAVQTIEVASDTSSLAIAVDPKIVIVVSGLAYLASLGVGFLATLVDNERLEKKYEALQDDHAASLATEFERLGSD